MLTNNANNHNSKNEKQKKTINYFDYRAENQNPRQIPPGFHPTDERGVEGKLGSSRRGGSHNGTGPIESD